MYYVYFLRSESSPSQRYTGYTNDFKRRLAEHNGGGDKTSYTYKYRPWKMEACILAETVDAARNAEDYFKNGSGVERFQEFEKSNPHHPNPIQGFFDTLTDGTCYRKHPNRIMWVRDKKTSYFVMKKQ
jgi:predicted GIY-YIG superfamily endonuclease